MDAGSAPVRPWVGRPIRRLEDPALVAGRGRFTADLPAARWVRFVRSPVAAGCIDAIVLPPGAAVFTAADLAGVKPIRPMLHKFGYVPIAQPVLASGVVRYTGELVAAVVAASEEEAEDLADLVQLDIAPTEPVVEAERAVEDGAPAVHPGPPRNLVVDVFHATPGHDAARAAAHRTVSCTVRSRRQSALPIETRAAHAAYDAAEGRVTLTCTTQMPHLARTAIADLIGMPECSTPGRGARRGRRVRAEDVARAGVRRARLARPASAHLSRLDRGPAREPDGELPRPRHRAARGRCLRRRGAARGADRRRAGECRRLRAVSEHGRR